MDSKLSPDENSVEDENIHEPNPEPNPEPDTPTNFHKSNSSYIDKITMECMMNKKHYKTYLAKTNPTRLKESRELQHKINEHGVFIEGIFENLLETAKKQLHGKSTNYNHELQHSFDVFIQNAVKYIETEAEMLAKNPPLGEDEYDDDTGTDGTDEIKNVWGKGKQTCKINNYVG
jgi:hypothetical protein